MTDAYLIQLEGQGDINLKLVNKEIYDWITSDNMGRPEVYGEYESEYRWQDRSVPASVKERLLLDSSADMVEVSITSGSWGNDRALQAPACFFNGTQGDCDSIKDLMEFCKEHDINIIETYEGCIY